MTQAVKPDYSLNLSSFDIAELLVSIYSRIIDGDATEVLSELDEKVFQANPDVFEYSESDVWTLKGHDPDEVDSDSEVSEDTSSEELEIPFSS